LNGTCVPTQKSLVKNRQTFKSVLMFLCYSDRGMGKGRHEPAGSMPAYLNFEFMISASSVDLQKGWAS
jgi:hypothetical protein